MQIISTNIGQAREIQWKGEHKHTGIYKSPVSEGIYLNTKGVSKDFIGNPDVHGGQEKACYVFGANHYPFWQSKYPELLWDWGMFGENITLDELKEKEVYIGAVYTLGETQVQVTLPREPCYKLGLKFGDQNVLEEFVASDHPGTYIKVLKEGHVKPGDRMTLYSLPEIQVSSSEFYQIWYRRIDDRSILQRILNHPMIPEKKKKRLATY